MRTIVLDDRSLGWRARLLAAEAEITLTLAIGAIAAVVWRMTDGGAVRAGAEFSRDDIQIIASHVNVDLDTLVDILEACELIDVQEGGDGIWLRDDVRRRATSDQRRRLTDGTKSQRWRERRAVAATAG